ncbi:MAG: cation-translocating P-type ATPase [Phenylobacterium sp.]|uniref:cation-translocating P-type ATPase n=1 Tax=Phenylobacterium sp. TaxID=1871053 RepID=UPI00391A8682
MARPAQRTGLSEAEAARRLAAFGPNELHKPRTRSLWAIVRGTLHEPMFLLLLGAAALYLVVGDLGEGLFLTVGACVSIALVIFQEARSERALAALRALAEPNARVIREGVEVRLPAREVVPGDLMLVGEGERAAADGMLVGGDVLNIDESLLTGESAPVAKVPQRTAPEGEDAGEDGFTVFAGTLVVRGHGVVEVTATGARTGLGKIGASLASIADQPTPLQRTSGRLVAVFGLFAVAFSALIVVAYGVLRGDWFAGMLAGITLAISLIPEEFPMVLAVFLALGAWRLARHKVLVRRAAAIEALGGATTLCVDKTGTLTENRMRVVLAWAEGEAHALGEGQGEGEGGGPPPAVARLLQAARLASAARSVDPMDRAVLELAQSPDADGAMDEEGPARTWPLRPDRPAVIQAWRMDGGEIAAAKGAPEAIFRLCRLPPEEIRRLEPVLDDLAAQGLRVLAAADSPCERRFPAQPEEAAFAFRGFVAFRDPIRPEVPEALAEARRAGISVAMITGDYPATALEIARQAGIDVGGGVLSGPEIAALPPQALAERVREVRVFARVRPDEKLALVEAFKAGGEVVVMTGDGVNDAPALEAAHIGIAMGQRGTDVAREAADLVLLDDSFASIVGGVRLGRRIFSNLRRALTYITAIHIPIAGLALAPIVLGLPPMLLPMHVVLLELVIDPVCSLVFESEPSERDAMRRPPRDPRETLFGAAQIAMAALQGAVILAAVFGLYLWALPAGEAVARGAAYGALVLSILMLAFADAASVSVKLFDRRHLVFWTIAGATSAILASVLYLPVLADIFDVAPPPPPLAALALGAALAGGGWVRLLKLAREGRGRGAPA